MAGWVPRSQRFGQTTLATSKVWSALGVKGGQLPSMQIGEYQPVMVMADFSRTLTAEPIEARAIVAGTVDVNIPGLDHAHLQLQSVAGGGIIVERLLIDCTTALGRNAVIIQIQGVPFFAGAVVSKLDVGGPATRSIVTADDFPGGPAGGEVVINNPPNVPIDLSEFRTYLRSGWFLHLWNYDADVMRVTLAWRELQEPIGVP